MMAHQKMCLVKLFDFTIVFCKRHRFGPVPNIHKLSVVEEDNKSNQIIIVFSNDLIYFTRLLILVYA